MRTYSSITETNFPNSSSPAISRCTIKRCDLSSLNHADSLIRSTITEATIAHQPSPTTARITIKRSNITHSTLTDSDADRCTLTHCKLNNLRSARRCKVINSAVSDQSALSRVDVIDSVVSESLARRSTFLRSRVLRSQLKRSTLMDCDVSDCIIIRSNLKGMVLRNAVWKNGNFIGNLGSEEAARVQNMDGAKTGVAQESWMKESDSEIELSDATESDIEAEVHDDKPPPYAP